MTFQETRRAAETLERSLESKCNTYQQITSRICTRLDLSHSLSSLASPDLENPGSSPAAADDVEETSLSTAIQSLLSQMNDTNDRLATLAAPTNPTATLLLKRYREIHWDYSSDFKKANDNLRRKREAAELFRGADASLAGGNATDPATEHLLRERAALNSSVVSSRGVLGQASQIFEELKNQRGGLTSAGSRVSMITENVPGINRVIDAIRRKKEKDNVILGCVLAFCILFVLWYWLG